VIVGASAWKDHSCATAASETNNSAADTSFRMEHTFIVPVPQAWIEMFGYPHCMPVLKLLSHPMEKRRCHPFCLLLRKYVAPNEIIANPVENWPIKLFSTEHHSHNMVPKHSLSFVHSAVWHKESSLTCNDW